MSNVVPFKIERQGEDLCISDTELSVRLGYSEIRNFRALIRKNADDLREFGLLRQIDAKGRGRSERVYWLNRAQAIHAVYRSDTALASALAIQLTKAFDKLIDEVRQPLTKELLALTILSPEVRVWEKRFEKPFFENLHRVLAVRGTGRNNHPNCGHFINRYVYMFLFGQLGLEVIQEANPSNDEYQRAFRHHQLLKPEHEPAFRQHISTLNTLLSVANGKQHFDDLFNGMFPKRLTQIGFAFNEMQARLSPTKEPAHV